MVKNGRGKKLGFSYQYVGRGKWVTGHGMALPQVADGGNGRQYIE
jgi:hypothetical protein